MLKAIIIVGAVVLGYKGLSALMDKVYAEYDRKAEYYDAQMRCQKRYPRIRFKRFKAWYEGNPDSWNISRLKSHAIVTKDGDADMTYSMRYKDYAATIDWLDRRAVAEWESYSYDKLEKSVMRDAQGTNENTEAEAKKR